MAFYIIKEAMYLHGVYGPYKSRKAAHTAFKEAYDKEGGKNWHNDFDGHHNYFIMKNLSLSVGESMCSKNAEIIEYKAKREND